MKPFHQEFMDHEFDAMGVHGATIISGLSTKENNNNCLDNNRVINEARKRRKGGKERQ